MIATQRQLKNTEHDNYQHLIPRYDRENGMLVIVVLRIIEIIEFALCGYHKSPRD